MTKPSSMLAIRLVEDLGRVTHYDLMEAHGWTRSHSHRTLRKMREDGMIQIVDWKRGRSARPLPVYGKKSGHPEPERPPAYTNGEKSRRYHQRWRLRNKQAKTAVLGLGEFMVQQLLK